MFDLENPKFKLNLNFKTNESIEEAESTESISFAINGLTYIVDSKFPLTMTLNEYLRDILAMTGLIL